jgi:alkanesulfonate monooxygenase SsuD/methylene tetrahydromethanopterin reductase-like flavin-dependent oxidoreductase (luciferase family)
MLECLTALSVAALATERCAVGSCVVQVPLRSPASLAKQASTLQVLSGGRLVLGVGSGSHPGEYEAAGVEYAARGRLLDEGLDAMRRCWEGGGSGDYRQLPTPAPVPVWIGGSSAVARRRAATRGDGWVPLFLGPGELAEQIGLLRRDVEDAGRDPGAVVPAAVVPVRVGPADTAHDDGARWLSSLYGIPPKAFTRHLVAGRATVCADHVSRYLEAGARHVVVMVAADDTLEHFEALAGELDRTVGRAAPATPPAPIRKPVAGEEPEPAEPAPLEVMA